MTKVYTRPHFRLSPTTDIGDHSYNMKKRFVVNNNKHKKHYASYLKQLF